MAPSTPLAPSSPENPSVRMVACLRCRFRRSKCTKDKPRCERCRDGNLECVYESGRKVAVNEASLRALQAQVRAYEELLGRRGPSLATDAAAADDNDDDDELEVEDDHVLIGPFTQLTIDRPGAADSFLINVTHLSGVEGSSGLDLNPNVYDPHALPSRRSLVRSQVRLPPLDVARRLFAAQYTYLGTIFAFTDPESFDGELLAAYHGQPNLADRDACLAYAKVLVILAFGKLYSVNQWIDYQGPPGFEYFTQALQLLPDAHEAGSILCVETLTLVGYFLQNMNRHDAAFLHVGMALRMAISLGLHHEVRPSDQSLSDPAREHRRRVWWSVYSMDRILSVKSGNPVTVHDEDIGARLPSALPGEAPYCPAVVLRHYTRLSQILGNITKAVYRKAAAPRSGRRLMASVESIIAALERWERELPDELRYDPLKLERTRESVSTFSHYYQCINMTARPLLYHVVQKRLADPAGREGPWKEGLSGTTVRVIEKCIGAARETITMMAEARKRDLVATYGYMDGEHVFSAAIVLVMVCAAFPADEANTEAMDTGLEILRGMAERGWNSHMGARYELLTQLRSVFMPGEAAPAPAFFGGVSTPWSGVYSPASDFLGAQVGVSPGLNFAELPRAAEAVLQENASGTRAIGSEVVGGGDVDDPLAATFSWIDHTMSGDVSMFDDDAMDRVDAVGSDGPSADGAVVMDFGIWEGSYANPTADAGYDLRRWGWPTQGP
ncbi:fungal-specific transcription factor domain-containing protein [Lasiosphaeris hirsuta]|uniref:Fungal-specific transcription factor domain-containing protein n=1 Tax=Lasiosphaeris hirsuta TaxID=260670 RepID=A0AA39ZYC5_9PEZI|nr:fungal-specific transcription factor domain-containing protein [Lasiosphaeris hirsuta]